MTLELNTLGDAETRDAWRAALVAHFEAHRGALSEDSLARLDKNPLRILDSKDPRDRPIADSAPGIDDFLTDEARAFFGQVTAGLDAAGVAWTRNARLVRGLDYYRHTAFEFVTDRLGAQGALIAGGRYDGLIESLGGPHTPAVGWAAGIERLGMMLEASKALEIDVIVVPVGIGAETEASAQLAKMRQAGIPAEMAFSGNLKKRMAKANASGALLAVIIGEDELARREASIRDLKSGEQVMAALDSLVSTLAQMTEAEQFNRMMKGISTANWPDAGIRRVGFISEPERK